VSGRTADERLTRPADRLDPERGGSRRRETHVPGPFRQGDEVTWKHAQGSSKGTVEQVHEERIEFEGQSFVGSEHDPVYIVESDETGARAAHEADGLSEA
jgi:hypothetical protein